MRLYYVKGLIGYRIDTSISSVSPNSKISTDGGNTSIVITGINFYNNFSQSSNAILVRVGSIILNANIINTNLINTTLPAGTTFQIGINNVSISLNAGENWTTEIVTFDFVAPSCPGNNCNGHGTCSNGNCTCDPGWSNSTNGCLDLIPGACGNGSNPCNNGTCIGLGLCQCNAGYSGTFCTTISCNGRNNCNSNG